MAIMIPSIPNEYTPASREGEMFQALKKLPDYYYVFHSFRMIDIINSDWKESEIDFVIFNRHKGIMCLEAKAGQVQCIEGIWYYASGIEMHDPFNQANTNKWKLKNEIYNFYHNNDILQHCKMLSAVWFPSLTKKGLSKIVLPTHAPTEIVLTAEDLTDPTESIERIFQISTPCKGYSPVTTELTKNESDLLLRNILCPSFNILPSKTIELDYKKEKFNSLIKEQCSLLNYLEDQRSAVINGAAGTGKTMIALEKARRHAVKGEKVLFLCFNVKLKEYLECTYKTPNVDYYTIDGFACRMCNTPVADFNQLESVLLDLGANRSFPYMHIVIDEGQDFGQNRIEETDIIQLLEEIILSTEKGTFYVFYDKLQMIQSFKMPQFIENADCRLTLYKNCRNTKKIAETSFKPLATGPKLFDFAIPGTLPNISFIENNEKEILDNAIDKIFEKGITNIQIVSCATQNESIYNEYLNNNGDFIYKGKEVKFTTCRKFKGLEADAVILVDVTFNALCDKYKLFYVGASRARLELSIICNMSNEECVTAIKLLGGIVKKNNPKSSLAKMLGCNLD